MKKFMLLIPLVSVALYSHVYAQKESLRNFPSFEPSRYIRLDMSSAFQKGTNLNTLQISKFRNLDSRKMFNAGGGLRLNNLNYTDKIMVSKGANETGFNSFMSSGMALGLNFMVNVEFNWNNRWCIGANTDLFGFGFGVSSVRDVYTLKKGIRREYEISPFNLGTVIRDVNYRSGIRSSTGILNSEIYGAFKIARKVWIRAAYSRLNADVLLKKVEEKYGYSSHLFSVGARFTY
jgi:hypothetical protein